MSQIKAKVLLVDDEERILRTLGMLLKMQYQVFSTTDGHEALRVLEREKIQLIISDQRMPVITGTQLLRQTKKISPNTMRILLTGYADLSAIAHVPEEGIVRKPYTRADLLARVRRLLGEGDAC